MRTVRLSGFPRRGTELARVPFRREGGRGERVSQQNRAGRPGPIDLRSLREPEFLRPPSARCKNSVLPQLDVQKPVVRCISVPEVLYNQVMRAWLMDSYDGVEKLRLAEVPDPQPGPGQALLKLKFAG